MSLKNLFIKQDEEQQQAAPTTVAQETTPVPASIISSTPTLAEGVTPEGTGMVGKDIEAKIWDMIIAKNLPGPDYIEFKNAAAGLVDIIPDKSMQMKGAFNVLKRSYPDFTKQTILSSIDTYIGIVNEEKEKGLKQCEELRKTKIGDKTAAIQSLKKTASDINAQIDELKKKYESTNADIHILEMEVTAATNEIAAKENTFKNSVQAVINTLNADKNEITNLNI